MNAYQMAADAVVCVHVAFVCYAVLGGLLVFVCRACVWFHLPAVLWAVFVEFADRTCPLTPLENWLRIRAGAAAYSTDFIEHYLVPLLYPAHLTRGLQIGLGAFVIAINAVVYAWLWHKRRHSGG